VRSEVIAYMAARDGATDSVAEAYRVAKARQRRWVPSPFSEGQFDWGLATWALEVAHGSPRHGNPDDPLDCLLYVMLTRKTPISVGGNVFRRLQRRYRDWAAVLADTPAGLRKLLHGSGLEEVKAGDMRAVLAAIQREFGGLSLDRLAGWSDDRCLRFLTGLPGVGTKTARCVMMYSLGRGVFPADTHCIRVLTRMGVVEGGLEHRVAQERLAAAVPGEYAYRLHVNLVAHGQKVCTTTSPSCSQCVVRKLCSRYRANAKSGADEQRGRPTVVDLFCGAGGTSLGLEMAGYRIVAAVDNDPWACQTFCLNHPSVPEECVVCSDIRHVPAGQLDTSIPSRGVDLVVGGPPCQGFSMIGKRVRGQNGTGRFIDDPRNELYREFVRFVHHLGPRIVVMENVPGLFSLRGGHYRRQIIEDLDHGYETDAVLVDAHRFGVPQHRQRVLFVGVSRGSFGEDAVAIKDRLLSQLKAHNCPGASLRQAISDLPVLQQDDGSEVMARPPRRGRRSEYAATMVTGSPAVVFNHVSRPLNVRDQLLYARLAPGETGHDAVVKHGARHLMVYRDDVFHDKYRRLVYDRPSPTVVAHLAKDGHMFIHPDEQQVRTITVREAARIQSFADDFIFYGPRTHQFQHVGNAVPPLLARSVGELIRAVVTEAGYEW